MSKVLVTGGGGFIGNHLCSELHEHGYETVVFDLKPPKVVRSHYIKGDVRDAEQVKRAVEGCSVIFHLAGVLGTEYLSQCPEYIAEAVQTNIMGSINVFEAAKRTGAIVVNTGLEPEWRNPYMITKKASTRFGQMYFEMFGTVVITLEVTHVYGPGQPLGPYQKAIPTFINQALSKSNEKLKVYGDGQRLMDCVYVSDAAKAFRIVAEQADSIRLMVEKEGIQHSILRLSSGETISVGELASKICQLTGSQSPIEDNVPMRPGEPVKEEPKEPDSERLVQELGWQPRVPLHDGLQRTIESYRHTSDRTKVNNHKLIS